MADTPVFDVHVWFPFFPRDTVKGDPVQIDLNWLDQAATAVSIGRMSAPSPSLRIIELAFEGEDLDFHLSFLCDGGFAGQAHFCVRRDDDGQNASLYWFYQLT